MLFINHDGTRLTSVQYDYELHMHLQVLTQQDGSQSEEVDSYRSRYIFSWQVVSAQGPNGSGLSNPPSGHQPLQVLQVQTCDSS